MELLKKKTFWYVLITLLVFCTDIWVYLYLKNTPGVLAVPTSSLPEPTSNKDVASLTNQIQNLPAIAHTPAEELKAIKTQAEKLSETEIQRLASDAVNPQANQDQRFKSVYLLAHNGNASLILKEIIKTPIPENINERDRDFEHILRAQAIEGIENGFEKNISRQVLHDLMQTTDNAFLLDRLSRAKNSLEGMSDSSEVQDNKELEKIIEN